MYRSFAVRRQALGMCRHGSSLLSVALDPFSQSAYHGSLASPSGRARHLSVERGRSEKRAHSVHTYSPHGVLLNGLVFHLWVCCWLSISCTWITMERRLEPVLLGPGCLCGCTPAFGFLYLSLAPVLLLHSQLLLFCIGLFHSCSKSSQLLPWANCSSFTPTAVLFILSLVTPDFS